MKKIGNIDDRTGTMSLTGSDSISTHTNYHIHHGRPKIIENERF